MNETRSSAWSQAYSFSPGSVPLPLAVLLSFAVAETVQQRAGLPSTVSVIFMASVLMLWVIGVAETYSFMYPADQRLYPVRMAPLAHGAKDGSAPLEAVM